MSAVGHEIDFTLSDFAADFRAPTPSAAAELLVPDAAELRRAIDRHASLLLRECAGAIRFQRSRLVALERSALFREPTRVLRERGQTLDALAEALRRAAALEVESRAARLRHAHAVIAAHKAGGTAGALPGARGACAHPAWRMRGASARASSRAPVLGGGVAGHAEPRGDTGARLLDHA